MATTSRSNAAPASRSDRDRLRDYYGLADGTGTGASSSSSPSSSSAAPAAPAAGVASASSPSIPTPTTLASLLSHHSSLLTSMRELDGERQSLVYNHHGDLVAASQTMERLNSSEKGVSLEETLQGLKRSVDAMTKWEGQLSGAGMVRGERRGGGEDKVDVAKDVLPIVTLPQRLRDVAALRGANGDEESGDSVKGLEQGLAAAEALWGRHEAVLSLWASQGVEGAAAVADDCRAVLREQRERVAEATTVATAATTRDRAGSSSMAKRQMQQAQLEQGGVGRR